LLCQNRGWWQSEEDKVNRQPPVSSIFLKDVSEVRMVMTGNANDHDEPGVSITLETQGRTDKVDLFFSKISSI